MQKNDILPPVLLLGDSRLWQKSAQVTDFADPQLAAQIKTLHAVLVQFQALKGFGRAIAAPQIGILKEIIAINLYGRCTTIINPRIDWRSQEVFTLWDDCFSFPELLVKVERSCSISISFQDEFGKREIWQNLDRSRSELLQHEIDHLNGILAIDRALNLRSIAYRSAVKFDSVELSNQQDRKLGEISVNL